MTSQMKCCAADSVVAATATAANNDNVPTINVAVAAAVATSVAVDPTPWSGWQKWLTLVTVWVPE